MRLKSLKLSGFKSFANPTTFTFKHGITAIVGPNGCGKSNVIDAIRWVLGESSAKQLRGGAMSDVIFAGTQDKVAKSYASVELTFEHTQDEKKGIRHELNLYHELSVRRQVGKDGKSDYYINGTRCRRRDVVDIFLGTGLGPRSYSVIQQGMIGRIVDSSPLQLREFIEEAAGVSRYQARRTETQKKLTQVTDNLVRLNDIKGELTRRQKSLAKQAESAEMYQQFQNELEDVKYQLAVSHLYQAKEEQIQAKSAQDNDVKQVDTLTTTQTTLNEKINKLNEQVAQAQWLKDSVRERLHEQDMMRQTLVHKLDNIESLLTQNQAQLQSNLEAQAQYHKDKATLNTDLDTAVKTLNKLNEQQNELAQKRQQQQDNGQPQQQLWREVNQRLNTLQDTKRSLEQQHALSKQAQHQLSQQQQKWAQNQQTWQNQLDALNQQETIEASEFDVLIPNLKMNLSRKTSADATSSRFSEFDKDRLFFGKGIINEITTQINSLIRQQEDISDRLEDAEPQLNQIKHNLNDKTVQLNRLQTRHATIMGEYDALHGMLQPSKSTTNLADANNSNTNDNSARHEANNGAQSEANKHTADLNKLSTLHDSITLTDKGKPYAKALDKWLTLWLDSRVFDSDNSIIDRTKIDSIKVGDPKVGNSKVDILNALLQHNPNQTDKAQSKNKKSKKLQNQSKPLQSLLFANQQATPKQNVNSDTLPSSVMPCSVMPLTQLIATPHLSIWQQLYLYDNQSNHQNDNQSNNQIDNSDNYNIATKINADELKDILSNLPKGTALLTGSGWCVTQSIVIHLSKLTGQTADNVQSGQFLSQRIAQQQRLDELEAALNEVETDIEQQTSIVKQLNREFEQVNIETDELKAQANQILHSKHGLEQRLTELKAQQQQQQSKLSYLDDRQQQLQLEKQELTQQNEQLSTTKSDIDRQLSEIAPKLETTLNEQQQLIEQRRQHDKQQQLNNEAWQMMQVDINKAQMAKDFAEKQLKVVDSSIKKLQLEQTTLETQAHKQSEHLPSLTKGLIETKAACHEQQLALDEHSASINQLTLELTQLQNKRRTIAAQLQQQQQQLSESSSRLAVADERIKEASERLDALNMLNVAKVKQDNSNTRRPSASALLTDFIMHGDAHSQASLKNVASLQQAEQTLTAKISKIGAVNLAAVAELAEVNERLNPLTQQIDDIELSITTLTDAITTIDLKTKTLFLNTLTAVNKDLTTLFTKVFGGGQATLTLIEDDTLTKSEKWRAGLELMAQPKGKRNSRLAVLSGGEKTLTALSLIFAIFKQHPAPFCVLDEVDAPLDDANVTRFTGLIDELAADVQFIFISHNKLAMQIADELKGVTMPQAGVSRLVSVSLAEAEQYLEG